MIDFNQSPDDLMKILVQSNTRAGTIGKYVSEYNVETHEIITDKAKYPDKEIQGSDGSGSTFQPVNRIALAIQKMIVDKSVSFSFGRPVTYLFTDEDQAEPVKKIFKQNKINSLTRTVARDLYSSSHTAEIWYAVENKEKQANEPDKYRLRCLPLRATKGDIFYPVFENGDMVAFVRELKKKDLEGKDQEYAEIYTDEFKITLINDGGWTESADFPREKNVIGKIPVVYGSQDTAEWSDIQPLIERLEALVSGHAEVNDYHFAPKLKATGEIEGFAKKGEKGAVFQMDPGADLEYLTWDQGTASLDLEFKNLWEIIYKMTQTPDISFESMRGLGAISGVAWRYFFMDAHLKVEMKREIWDDYLIRRVNIVKAFVGKLINTSLDSQMDELDCEIQINPYIIDDLSSKIAEVKQGCSKDVISQRQAVKMLGIAEDVEEELSLINSENTAETIK